MKTRSHAKPPEGTPDYLQEQTEGGPSEVTKSVSPNVERSSMPEIVQRLDTLTPIVNQPTAHLDVVLSPGYYPATATFQASQLRGENNPFELDWDEVNFLSEPDLDSGRDEPRGAAILDSGSQHAAYDAILDRGALRDISACLTPKDNQKRELHERDPLVLVSSLESQTLPGPHSHLSVIEDHVADAVMEGRLAAVEASAAELKASNETLLASNKAIKDQNDAMHNMMMTMMERLANSNAAPDAVATGPKNKGAGVPTAQPTAAGSDAGVQPALNPLPAHAAGSASASPNLEPVPANPPPHTLPPVVPALGMLPPPTWSHPGVVPARPRAGNKHHKVRGRAEKALRALRRADADGDSSDSLPTEGFTTDASTTPARLLARHDARRAATQAIGLQYPAIGNPSGKGDPSLRPYDCLPPDLKSRAKKAKQKKSLPFPSYVCGFLRMVARELDPLSEASEKVIHLSQVAHDVECFTWEGAQEWSLAVQKYIQDSEATWANTLLFDHERTRLSYSTGARPPPNEIPCPAYGADTCEKKEGHIEGQFKMAHHCSICMHALGKARPHSLAKCPIKRNVYKAVDSQEGGGRRRRGGSHGNAPGKKDGMDQPP